MEFYVYLNGARRGPFPEERVQEFLSQGLLHPEDLASAQPEGEWKPLSAFRRFDSGERARVVSPPAEIVAPKTTDIAAAPPMSTPVEHDAPPSVTRISALGPYARVTLAPNETAFFTTTLHWSVFARYAALGIALFLFAAIPFAVGVQAFTGSERGWFVLPLPALLLIPPAIAFASSEIVVTDRRILIKTGAVHRQTTEMFISKVESIAVNQGVLGRMFDCGTVKIRGTGGFEESFNSIAKPLLLRDWVHRLQSGDLPRSGELPETMAVATSIS